MDSVLIVSAQDKSIAPLAEILIQNGYTQIVTVDNCGEARRLLPERQIDLCIVNAPLSDEFGDLFACQIMTESQTQVLLIVREGVYEEITGKVSDYGVFTISKPINRTVLWSTLKLIAAARNKVALLEKENTRLTKKIEEMRLINRAKCLLIQYLGVSEKQAHKFIEKQAMDLRITKAAVARNILKTYEN